MKRMITCIKGKNLANSDNILDDVKYQYELVTNLLIEKLNWGS